MKKIAISMFITFILITISSIALAECSKNYYKAELEGKDFSNQNLEA